MGNQKKKTVEAPKYASLIAGGGGGNSIVDATDAADAIIVRVRSALGDQSSPLSQLLSLDEQMGKPSRDMLTSLCLVSICLNGERAAWGDKAMDSHEKIQAADARTDRVAKDFLSKIQAQSDQAIADSGAAIAKAIADYENRLRTAVRAPKGTNVLQLVVRQKESHAKLVGSQARLQKKLEELEQTRAGEKGGLTRSLRESEDRVTEIEAELKAATAATASPAVPDGALVLNEEQATSMRLVACTLGGLGGNLKETLGAAKVAEHIFAGVAAIGAAKVAAKDRITELTAELTAATAATASPAVPVDDAKGEAKLAKMKGKRAEAKARIAELEAYNARLEAENVGLMDDIDGLKAEAAELVAEVMPWRSADARKAKAEKEADAKQAEAELKADAKQAEQALQALRNVKAKAGRMFDLAGMTEKDDKIALWGGTQVGFLGDDEKKPVYAQLQVMAPVAIIYKLSAADKGHSIIVAQSVRFIDEYAMVLDQYTEPGSPVSGVTLDFKAGGQILSAHSDLGVRIVGADAEDAPDVTLAQVMSWTQNLATTKGDLCKGTHTFLINGSKVTLTNAPMLTRIGRRQRATAEANAKSLLV